MSYNDEEQEPAIVECVIVRETEKAVLIMQGDIQTWIPRSQCQRIFKLGFNKKNKAYKDATIEMGEWLAEERGLDYK